jgi:hypothetical protein
MFVFSAWPQIVGVEGFLGARARLGVPRRGRRGKPGASEREGKTALVRPIVPAGRYAMETPTREAMIFRSTKTGRSVAEARVITRLAAPATPLTEARITFDKVGDQYFVSEVWFPERDGFLLYGATEAHTHEYVVAIKKK